MQPLYESFWGYPEIKLGGHVNYHKIVMTSPLATVPWGPQKKLANPELANIVNAKQLTRFRRCD